MARPPRPSDRPRGEGRDRRAPGDRRGADRGASRRPGEGSGALRRAPEPRPTRSRSEPDEPARRRSGEPERLSATEPRRQGWAEPGDRPRRRPREGTTAHPEDHRLTTRTDTSATVLGPRNYTPRRVGLLAVIAIVLLVTMSYPLRNHYQYLSEQKAVAQEQASLQQDIAGLEDEEKRLQDPAYVEQLARTRFGAVAPGERPYRISQVGPEEKAARDRAAAEDAATPWQTKVWNSIASPREPVAPATPGH